MDVCMYYVNMILEQQMYVCMYVCVYVCIHANICMYCVCIVYACIYKCMYVCIYVCIVCKPDLSLEINHLQLLVVPLPDLLRSLALHLSHACRTG